MKRAFFLCCLMIGSTLMTSGQLTNYGKLIKFTVTDRAANPREVQVFIPRNLDREVPAKVLWYFRGTNGIFLTWNIETTRLYKIGYDEKAVIVAPNLFAKLWSKGTDETDYYLIHDLLPYLQDLVDEQGLPYKLDLENMAASGFSAGGGFLYNMAGYYPKIFNNILFRKFLIHGRPLAIKVDEDGNAVSGDDYDIQAFNRLKEAFNTVYAVEKPLFLLSIGTRDFFPLQDVVATRDYLAAIGYSLSMITVPGLNHRFLTDYSEEFKKQIKDFFCPLHITQPEADAYWKVNPLAQTTLGVTWSTLQATGENVNLDLVSVDDHRSYTLGRNLENSGAFTVDPLTLPTETGRYFLKIHTPDKLYVNYSSAFSVEYQPVAVNLQVIRTQERAWIIRGKEYARLEIGAQKQGDFWIARFLILRKIGAGDEQLLIEIPGSEFQQGTYTHIDESIVPGVSYTYRVEALDDQGNVLATSEEKAI